MSAVEVIVRLAWLALIVWGAWRTGVGVLALPWRWKKHPQRFGGYLRDVFMGAEPFLVAFAVVWASVPLMRAFGLAAVAPLTGVGLGIVVVSLGLPIRPLRRAHARVLATRGAAA